MAPAQQGGQQCRASGVGAFVPQIRRLSVRADDQSEKCWLIWAVVEIPADRQPHIHDGAHLLAGGVAQRQLEELTELHGGPPECAE